MFWKGLNQNARDAISTARDLYKLSGVIKIELLTSAIDHVYKISSDDGDYILRFYVDDKYYYLKGKEDLLFELELVNHVFNSGLGTAAAIPTESGSLLGVTKFDGVEKYVSLFEFIEGKNFSSAGKQLGAELEQRFGALMANFHQIADSFTCQYPRYTLDTSTFLLKAPLDALESVLSSNNLGDISFFYPFAEKIEAALSTLPRSAPSFGIIHADVTTDNVMIDSNGKLYLIDFECCCYGYRAHDLVSLSESMLQGYESVRPLSKIEKELQPTFYNLLLLEELYRDLITKKLSGKKMRGREILRYRDMLMRMCGEIDNASATPLKYFTNIFRKIA